jgi:hypothetical protein
VGRLEQQLPVDEQLADEDARPPAQAEEVEGGDAEADGRPDRRDRGRVPQRLAELRRAEIDGSERDDADEVADGGPPKRRGGRLRSELSWG